MELHKRGDIGDINPKIAGDLVAKTFGYENIGALQQEYTKGAFSQRTRIIHCGTELPKAPVKEQFSFLQSCKGLVIPAVERLAERMDKLAGKFMPNGIGVKSPIER